MSRNSSDNSLVEKAIRQETADDPVMCDFLMEIFETEKKTSQFKQPYDAAIEKAIKKGV